MKVSILGVQIDSITMEQAVQKAMTLFDGEAHTVFTPNPEIIMAAQGDKQLLQTLNEADMLLPDGIGVVIASRLLGQPLPERVPGFDFVCRLLQTDKSFYLLGGKPGVAQEAANRLQQRGVRVAGAHHGYFKHDQDVLEDVARAKPDVLLVCLGAPKQEKWIETNKEKLPPCLCIGAGGTLDVLAGTVKRAPKLYQKLYLEWLYRAVRQPSRLPRLAELPKFLCRVVASRGGNKR